MNEREATQLVEELWDGLYSSALRYAAHIAGSLPIAEDAVQDTFLKLYQSLRRGHEVEQPKAWIFVVLRRETLKRMQDASRYGSLEPEETRNLIVAPIDSARPVEADDLTELLSCLSSRETEVMLLRLSNLKYREIGAQLGIGGKSVATFLARALEKLRANVGGGVSEEAIKGRVKKHAHRSLR